VTFCDVVPGERLSWLRDVQTVEFAQAWHGPYSIVVPEEFIVSVEQHTVIVRERPAPHTRRRPIVGACRIGASRPDFVSLGHADALRQIIVHGAYYDEGNPHRVRYATHYPFRNSP
jgi:hypothetical protein